MIAQSKLRMLLEKYQKRIRMGEKFTSFIEIARRAGIHRDTIYTLLAGNRISTRSQYALSRVLMEVEEETCHLPQKRFMSISLDTLGLRIKFGEYGGAVLKK